MTEARQKKEPIKRVASRVLPFLMLIFILYFALFVSGRITDGIAEGLKIATLTVLPSAFPFMIVSDIYYSYGYPEKIGGIGKITEKLFHLPTKSLRALMLGNIAGFPIGAKVAAELYSDGGIDRKNAEKLLAYSNNPSIAFIVSCVGSAILKNTKIGLFLLIVIYISTLFCAFIYRERTFTSRLTIAENRHPFDLVHSVKTAGITSISIISFIVTFFGIASILKLYISNQYLLSVISSFLEVTRGVSLASALHISYNFKLALIAFALGFGGLSVMMQTAVFSSDKGLSLIPYFKIKLTEGIIAAILTFLCYPLCFT